MFLVSPEDIIAIRRAHMVGQDKALAECRRRWPALTDRALPGVLDRVLTKTKPQAPRFSHGVEASFSVAFCPG